MSSISRPLTDGMAMMTSFDRVLLDQRRQVARGADHAHAVDAQVLLLVVVVDEADRAVADAARLLHLAHDELSGVAGAHDQHLLAVAAELLAPGPLPGRCATACGRRP